MNKKGFTIAEILVTLIIIGVVAALAIPGLVNSSGNRQFESAFKKAYADLNSATEIIMRRYSGNLAGIFTNDNSMLNIYENELKIIKKCYYNEDFGTCWHKPNEWKTLDGVLSSTNKTNTARAISKNGMLYIFERDSTSCSDNKMSLNSENIACGKILVDINGFNKPNIIGRDIFHFRVTKYGLYPSGVPGEYYYDASFNNCTSSSTGHSCAARILIKGKMDY